MQLFLQIKTDYFTLIRFYLQKLYLIPDEYLIFGGGKRDRTDDPLLAKQVLYQLSYAPSILQFGSFKRL